MTTPIYIYDVAVGYDLNNRVVARVTRWGRRHGVAGVSGVWHNWASENWQRDSSLFREGGRDVVRSSS